MMVGSISIHGIGSSTVRPRRIVTRVADLAQAMEDVLPEEAGSSVALRRYAEALAGYGVRVVTDGA